MKEEEFKNILDKGETVYFGVEDSPINVTGCDRNYDSQRIIEGIYDKTRPSLFTEIEDFEYIFRWDYRK